MQTSFTTDRLLIEPLTENDSDFILELVNTDGWIRFIGNRNINTPADAVVYIQKIIGNPGITYWVVKLKESQLKAGVVTFIKRDYLDHSDIGFAFLPGFANNGYAFEASNTVLDSMVKNSGLSLVLATTIPENFYSIKLLKKLGFRFDKEIEVGNEKLHVYEVSADKLRIDEITRSFFRVFTNTNNITPNLALLNTLCIPEVLIINRTNSDDIYNLASFIEPRLQLLTNGTLKDFEEQEIFGETEIIHNIAQRYCEYQKTGILEGKSFKQKGHKLLQFIKTNEGWKISSVIWEDEKI
jgi:RimJ/RimL family protein N-acetyltransferase